MLMLMLMLGVGTRLNDRSRVYRQHHLKSTVEERGVIRKVLKGRDSGVS